VSRTPWKKWKDSFRAWEDGYCKFSDDDDAFVDVDVALVGSSWRSFCCIVCCCCCLPRMRSFLTASAAGRGVGGVCSGHSAPSAITRQSVARKQMKARARLRPLAMKANTSVISWDDDDAGAELAFVSLVFDAASSSVLEDSSFNTLVLVVVVVLFRDDMVISSCGSERDGLTMPLR